MEEDLVLGEKDKDILQMSPREIVESLVATRKKAKIYMFVSIGLAIGLLSTIVVLVARAD